jgi:hypothetical protein
MRSRIAVAMVISTGVVEVFLLIDAVLLVAALLIEFVMFSYLLNFAFRAFGSCAHLAIHQHQIWAELLSFC